MNIKTIASSSSGCLYIVESNGYQLLIEAGVSLKKIRQALDFDLSKVVGCIVSHEHADHSGFLPNIEAQTAIPIWCSETVKTKYNLSTSQNIKNRVTVYPLGFAVLCIELDHDVLCYGFIIWSEGKTLFYCSDTGSLPNISLKGLTHLMIESNHSMETLINSEQNKELIRRIAANHLDIDQAVEFAVKHKKSLEEVHLIHLSSVHGQDEQFKNLMASAVGVPVYVSEK